jgi:hypothetical protein
MDQVFPDGVSGYAQDWSRIELTCEWPILEHRVPEFAKLKEQLQVYSSAPDARVRT